jgi:hypothetical protein
MYWMVHLRCKELDQQSKQYQQHGNQELGHIAAASFLVVLLDLLFLLELSLLLGGSSTLGISSIGLVAQQSQLRSISLVSSDSIHSPLSLSLSLSRIHYWPQSVSKET